MSFFDNTIELIRSFLTLGGPVVAILFAVSIIALAVILAKVFQFWQRGIGTKALARKAVECWRDGRPREAIEIARRGKSPSARAIASALMLSMENRLSKNEIEEALSRDVNADLHGLQSGFRFLDAVAQMAPLLGLFGTVLGMIDAFRSLQEAGSVVDPSILAGGIWVALLTTAAGLAVAMPVSIVLTWLETRVENERMAVETVVADILSPRTTFMPAKLAGAFGSGEMAIAE
ncbi:MAG: MotA/TolQ/ExbB proton channel family protein [Ahrensia sp.]|nr:MotA/TolQ/ExbB proton channel family protein [Ahrensia sp.]